MLGLSAGGKEVSEGAICKWWLGLWIAQSGRLKGDYVMSLVIVSDRDSNGEDMSGCGWCDQHTKDQKCLFHTEPVTYSLLSRPTERRLH